MDFCSWRDTFKLVPLSVPLEFYCLNLASAILSQIFYLSLLLQVVLTKL